MLQKGRASARILRKLGQLDTKKLLIYSYGLTIIAMNKKLITEDELDQMIAQTNNHAPHL